MNRLAAKFEELKQSRRKGFIPFITAGDPDIATSLELVSALTETGADIIELGVPFSDPMADGPTIQSSSQRALNNNVTLSNVLELVASIRKRTDIPIVLFSYLNPLFRYGYERLAVDAAQVGVDGVLVTDAVDQEASEIAAALKNRGTSLISLIAPTTTDERLESIAGASCGFLYAVSRNGVTGARESTSHDAEILVRRARRFTDLPVAVGFGISTRTQIENVWKYADAAVVGSAIVAEIAACKPGENPVDRVRTFATNLIPATR
ncbi:MAG: tryptophan synthase subunit alpha [Pyrinomonadaceae bacterium]